MNSYKNYPFDTAILIFTVQVTLHVDYVPSGFLKQRSIFEANFSKEDLCRTLSPVSGLDWDSYRNINIPLFVSIC